jgi:hypothetical protein
MKRRFEFETVEGPSVVDRIARAMAGDFLRRMLLRLHRDMLRAFDRASARAVACLVAAALFIIAAVLLVNAGLLGLIAIHVPPALAYLGIGILALIGAWLVVRTPSVKSSSEDLN